MLSDDLKSELEDICNENNLMIDFDFNYPIKARVKKMAQTTIFDQELPKEAYLEFIFQVDNLDFKFVGDFKLDDKLFNKLLTKVKKLHYIYLQEWYAQRNNRFKDCIKPIFDITNGDYVALVKRCYEG